MMLSIKFLQLEAISEGRHSAWKRNSKISFATNIYVMIAAIITALDQFYVCYSMAQLILILLST